MDDKIFKRGGFIKEGVPFLLLVLLLIGIVIFIFSNLKTKKSPVPPTPPTPQIVTPLPPTVTPGKITFQTPLPGAKITLEFWDVLGRKIIAGPVSQTTNSQGGAQLDAKALLASLISSMPPGDYPVNAKADLIVEKDGSKLHFQADMEVTRGALFWVKEEGGKLTIDTSKTSFYPLTSAGPQPGSLEEQIKSSLKEIEQ